MDNVQLVGVAPQSAGLAPTSPCDDSGGHSSVPAAQTPMSSRNKRRPLGPGAPWLRPGSTHVLGCCVLRAGGSRGRPAAASDESHWGWGDRLSPGRPPRLSPRPTQAVRARRVGGQQSSREGLVRVPPGLLHRGNPSAHPAPPPSVCAGSDPHLSGGDRSCRDGPPAWPWRSSLWTSTRGGGAGPPETLRILPLWEPFRREVPGQPPPSASTPPLRGQDAWGSDCCELP